MATISNIFDGRMIRARDTFHKAYTYRFGEGLTAQPLPAMIFHTGEVLRHHASFGDQSEKDIAYRLHLAAMLNAYRDVVAALENSEDLMIRTQDYADSVFELMARIGNCFREDIQPLDTLEMDVVRLEAAHRSLHFTSLAISHGRVENAPRGIEPDYVFGN